MKSASKQESATISYSDTCNSNSVDLSSSQASESPQPENQNSSSDLLANHEPGQGDNLQILGKPDQLVLDSGSKGIKLIFYCFFCEKIKILFSKCNFFRFLS